MKPSHSTPRSSGTAGFTLLEILVVVVIVGILSAIVAPSWVRFLANRRAQAVQTELLQVLQEAQSTALNTRETQYVRIGVPVVTEDITGGVDDVPVVQFGSSSSTTFQGIIADLLPQTTTLGQGELNPGMVTINQSITRGGAFSAFFRFDFKGVARNPLNNNDNPFYIDITAANSGRIHCIASISVIGNLVSGSGDDCTQFRNEVVNNL